MAVSSRHSLVDTYDISYRNEYSNNLDTSAPYSRESFLKLLSQSQLDALYKQFYASLEEQIRVLKEADSPIASMADEILVEMKRLVGKSFSIEDMTLLNLLYQTDKLIKTPYLGQDKNINPEFTERAERYHRVMTDVQKTAKYKTLAGVGNALLSGLIIAAIIGLAVWTFGIAGVTAARTIAMATFSSSLMFGISAMHGVSAGGLFSDAYRLKKVASKMEPLVAMGSASKREGEFSPHPSPSPATTGI